MLRTQQRVCVAPIALLFGLLLLTSCGGGNGVQIKKGERSPPIKGASVQITAPTDSAVVDSAGVDVTIQAKNFQTG
ncbi:MAG: hypothetical protein ABEK84_06215, partial [Salinibacter sp.]